MPISASSLLQRQLLNTEQKQPPPFTLQVKRSRSKGGLAGPDGTKSVFGQMCAKMSSFSPDSLLLPHRVWKVKFVGRCWAVTQMSLTSLKECYIFRKRGHVCRLSLDVSHPGCFDMNWLVFLLRRVCGRLRWRLQRVHRRNV